jgi:hypothetical protein
LLFETFAINSEGNFYHFSKVLDSLIDRFPLVVFDLLLNSDENVPPLILLLVRYLHRPPLANTLFKCLIFSNPDNPRDRMERYERLQEIEFFECLLNNLRSNGADLFSLEVNTAMMLNEIPKFLN